MGKHIHETMQRALASSTEVVVDPEIKRLQARVAELEGELTEAKHDAKVRGEAWKTWFKRGQAAEAELELYRAFVVELLEECESAPFATTNNMGGHVLWAGIPSSLLKKHGLDK